METSGYYYWHNSNCTIQVTFVGSFESTNQTKQTKKNKHKTEKSRHLYLLNETPGKISIFALRAARFIAVIPLTVKHVTISSLAKQFENNLRNADDSSLVGAATATAKTADKTMNTFILICLLLFFLLLLNTKLRFFFPRKNSWAFKLNWSIECSRTLWREMVWACRFYIEPPMPEPSLQTIDLLY